MSNLIDRVKALFAANVPVSRRTVYNVQQAPETLARNMDVDRVHAVFRQAETGDTRDLFSLYRDIVIADNHAQSEFGKRKLAVLGDVLTVQPSDKKQSTDVVAATAVSSMIDGVPGWIHACSHLLDSVLWPVAVVEKVFRPTAGGYALAALIPVPADLLFFGNGRLQIRDTDERGNLLATFHDPDPARYIVHRGHLLSAPDNWGGPMRSIVFWWLLGAMDRDWWARFLDRYGSPFLVGKYSQNDDQSRTVLERAFSVAVKIGGLVVSKETDVEIQQAAAGNTGDAYEKFVTFCNREKSKLIVGQTLSAEAQATGLGSGVAKSHDQVRDDIRQFDARLLGETLRDQLISQFLRINGIVGQRPKLIWGAVDAAEQTAAGTLLQNLSQAGLEVTDDGIEVLSERFGFGLRRKVTVTSAPLSPMSFVALSAAFDSADAQDRIARSGSAELAQAFRGAFAPVRRLIAMSRSAEELESSLRAFYPDLEEGKAATLIEQALNAYAANGTLLNTRK